MYFKSSHNKKNIYSGYHILNFNNLDVPLLLPQPHRWCNR